MRVPSIGSALARLRSLLTSGQLATLTYLAGSVLGRAAALVLVPLYTRKLTVPEYGYWGLWNTIVLFFVGVGALGLQSSVPREFFARANAEASAALRVAQWGLTVGAASASLAAVATMFLPDVIGGISRADLRLALLAGLGALSTGTLVQYLKARQAARWAVALELVGLLLTVALSLLFVVRLGLGARGAILASCVTSALTGALCAGLILSAHKNTPSKRFTEYLGLALPTIPHFFSVWLLGQADRWVLQSQAAHAELGLYTLGLTLASPGTILLAAFHDAYGARIGEMFRRGGVSEIAANLRTIRRRYALVAVAACVGSAAFATLAMKVAVSAVYRDAFLPALLISLLPLGDVLYYSDSNILYYSDRTRLQSVITTSAAVFSVLCMFGGAYVLGAWGVIAGRGAGLVMRGAATAAVGRMVLGPRRATPGSLA